MELEKMYCNVWYKKLYVWLYALMGALALAGILTFLLGVADVNGWRRAKGVVNMTTSSDQMTVEFDTADGQHIVTELHDFDTSLSPGRKTNVRYKADDPTDVHLYGTTVTLGICFFVAAVMTAILATTYLADDRKKYRSLLAVSQKGQPVECDVLNVFPDLASMGRKNKNRYRLECAFYPETAEGEEQKIWVFLSDSFVNERGKFAGKVTTWVNFDDPDQYYVDLSTLQIAEGQPEDAPKTEDAI